MKRSPLWQVRFRRCAHGSLPRALPLPAHRRAMAPPRARKSTPAIELDPAQLRAPPTLCPHSQRRCPHLPHFSSPPLVSRFVAVLCRVWGGLRERLPFTLLPFILLIFLAERLSLFRATIMPQGTPLRMPSLARRSSPAAADPSHTSHSPTPPPSARACPIALTCWAHCRAGFAQLSSSSGLLTWVLAHVGGAPPTPISRSRSADAVQDFVRDPCKIPCKILC